MGLDTTHNAWHGPYSSFNEFREALALQIGIRLDDYIGYDGDKNLNLKDISHDIQPLLDHSDCDGILTPEECARVAYGLNQIQNNFNEQLKAPGDFKQHIENFKNGCLLAVSKNEPIRFH